MKNKTNLTPQAQGTPTVAMIEASRLKRLPLKAGLALAIVVWVLFNVFEHEYLFRVQELSLWLPTKVYFDERMLVPGGLMSYIACFLTQFFYYPMLGSFIYVALLLVVQWLVIKVFRIPARHASLALIPSVLILCCSMEAGYWIFQIKTQGYFYSMLVGFLFALSAMRLYQVAKGWWRYLIIIGVAAVGYPLFGFYASLALMGIALWTLREGDEGRVLVALLCVAAVIATPILYYSVYEQTRFADMFTVGMPAFEFSKRDLFTWVPYILLYLFPLVMPFIPLKREGGAVPKKNLLWEGVGTAAFIVMLGLVFWFRDPNFRAEIKMNHHMERLEWRKALDVAKAQKQTPTRLIVLNKNLSLLKLGRIGDEMFHYLDGGEAPDSPLQRGAEDYTGPNGHA